MIMSAMANAESLSIYHSLNSSKAQIRLLRLQPHLEDSLDTITATLEVANLNDQDCHYEALSYEWGSAANTSFSITLQGKEFAVRENLWWALWHLRLEKDVRILWIDALCIDQGSVLERNHQVNTYTSKRMLRETLMLWRLVRCRWCISKLSVLLLGLDASSRNSLKLTASNRAMRKK